MLRLKLNLKIELNEYEEKQQLFILKKAESIKVDEEGVPQSAISYGARVSEWDM